MEDASPRRLEEEPVGTSDTDLALMAAMDEIHMALPFYGIRRIRGAGGVGWISGLEGADDISIRSI